MVRNTLPPKMHPHTKFGIPTLNDKEYALDTIILEIMSELKVTLNKKMIRDTSPPQDTPIYQIWDSYLRENRRYALDTIILGIRSQ